jgi:hypothetical protein
MDEFIEKLTKHTGIDKSTAEKVIAFLKDHADDVTKFIADHGIKDKLPGGLGKLF